MARKKQKNGKSQNAKARNLKSQQDSKQNSNLRISPLAFWTRQFILLTTLVAGLILVITALLTNWYNETPTTMKWGMNIGAFIISAIRLRESIYGHKNKSYLISKKSAIIDAVLVGLIFVIFSIPILRGTGVIDKLTSWVNSILPMVNQAISEIIAWILTFAIPSAISGIIGNYAYDKLKNISLSKGKKDS